MPWSALSGAGPEAEKRSLVKRGVFQGSLAGLVMPTEKEQWSLQHLRCRVRRRGGEVTWWGSAKPAWWSRGSRKEGPPWVRGPAADTGGKVVARGGLEPSDRTFKAVSTQS